MLGSFAQAQQNAKAFGMLLGYILASKKVFVNQTITLIGFSLGTHVIKNCLKKMSEIAKYDESVNFIVSNVVLIAGKILKF